MTPHDLARLYLEKGQDDEGAAKTLAANTETSDAIIGFHCQQSVEKYLKAVLAIQEVRVARTHEIGDLILHLREAGLEVPEEFDGATELSPYAVRARYPLAPGESKPLDRPEVLRLVAQIREWVEHELG